MGLASTENKEEEESTFERNENEGEKEAMPGASQPGSHQPARHGRSRKVGHTE